MSLQVHSLESFGTHEGPGIRYVIFLQGCLFRCAYCHNPDTIPLEGGTIMNMEELIQKILKTKDYFGTKGGVTVSGGEPLLQAKQLLPFFKRLHEEGINTTIDTNGYVRNDDVKALLEYTDLVLLDVKHINLAQHKKLTGKGNESVLQFAHYLDEIKKAVRLRYVFVPGWTDQEEALHEWAMTLSPYKNIERVEILPYHRLGEYKRKSLGWKYALEGVDPPSKESIDHCKAIFEQYFPKVRIR